MSHPVTRTELPAGSLLGRYCIPGGHVDCYVCEVDQVVDLAALITAFYTSGVFAPERWLIGALLGKRAGRAEVEQLAQGTTGQFSAWSVEARSEDQLLLCDYQGRTCSWLMVKPTSNGTRLHFGSAVVPARRRAERLLFKGLLWFHAWYSCLLLRGAVARLQQIEAVR